MGNWRLEAFKMTIYMVFPVGCFWLFNQPGIFENWIMEKRKLLYTPEDPKAKETIQKMIETMDMQRQMKLENQMMESKAAKSS